MNTIALQPASVTIASTQMPRVDLYTPIHKALRHFMTDTLVRVGRLDVDDAEEVRAAVAQIGGLLAMLRAHVAHEDGFIHAAIEPRRPGALDRPARDHEDHLGTIDALEAEAQALPHGGDREAAALHLYRHLALFVAEQFEHMQLEETANHALLWELFDDAALVALHDRLVASIPQPVMAVILQWMARSLNLGELAALLGAMKAALPPQALAEVLDLMRAGLSPARWGRLASRLGVPQVPGLVAFAG